MLGRRRLLEGFIAAVGLTGCGMHRGRTTFADARRTAPDPLVGRYESSPWSFSTASYWLDGPEGVVVFGTQFLRSEARAVISEAEATTGKRVVAAVVHHANPDKFNGTATFQAHGAKVLTSSQVLAAIPEVHAQRLRAFGSRYAPDFPLEAPTPDSLGDATRTVVLGGAPITFHVLGAGCGRAHVVSQWRDHLFVGDLVAHGAHSWMELGLLDAWLARLEELAGLNPAHVHPGRGVSGGPGLLESQASYLREVGRQVARTREAFPHDRDSAEAHLYEALVRLYPAHRFAAFLKVAVPTLLASPPASVSVAGGTHLDPM